MSFFLTKQSPLNKNIMETQTNSNLISPVFGSLTGLSVSSVVGGVIFGISLPAALSDSIASSRVALIEYPQLI